MNPADDDLALYCTLPEVAARWQLSVQTLRRWIKAGQLRPVLLGRSLRIERAEIQRLEATWRALRPD